MHIDQQNVCAMNDCCAYLYGGQAFLAVALLNTNVDVVLGMGGLSVLFSRIRKRICTLHSISVSEVCLQVSRHDTTILILPPKMGVDTDIITQQHTPFPVCLSQFRENLSGCSSHARRSGSLPKPPRLGWMFSSTSVISSGELGKASAKYVSDKKSECCRCNESSCNLKHFGKGDSGSLFLKQSLRERRGAADSCY